MTYLPGTKVKVDLGLAGDVVAEVVEVYGPPGQRHVLVRLAPEFSGDLVAEPVVRSLPASAVRDVQTAA
jgi:hypothetical protein